MLPIRIGSNSSLITVIILLNAASILRIYTMGTHLAAPCLYTRRNLTLFQGNPYEPATTIY
jgi:hypothetical protein